VDHRNLLLDLELITLTGVAILSRQTALRAVARRLQAMGAAPELVRIATRSERLEPAPPPGASQIVMARH
jgi:hypothetical protein